MSNVTRKGLELTLNQIGNAKFAYSNLISNSSNTGLGIKTQYLYNKIVGSNIFHDYDLCLKDPLGINEPRFQTYDNDESIKFGLQGGSYIVNPQNSSFGNTLSWSPAKYSPPSPEGWYVYDYNAWSNYIPQYNASGIANTSLLIYNVYSEPTAGSARTTYSYPVRYTGSSYSRVNLFNSARYISLYFKNAASIIDLTLPKNYFDGVYNVNPFTNTPIDLGIYSHANLLSYQLYDSVTLDGTMGVQGVSDTLNPLAYTIFESDGFGNTSARIRDHYRILANPVAGAVWSVSKWMHLVFYWGTYDLNFKSSYPSYASGTAATYLPTDLNSNIIIFPKKSFFNKKVSNYVTFDKTGINDQNVYLFNDKTRFTRQDGTFLEEESPFRYKIDEILSGVAITNSLSQASPRFNEIFPAIITSYNFGSKTEQGRAINNVIFGQSIPKEFLPDNLDEFIFYPEIPENHSLIAKIILAYNSLDSSGTAVGLGGTLYNNNNASIIYIKHEAENFASPGVQDVDIFNNFSGHVINLRNDTLSQKYNNFFDSVGTNLVPNFAGYTSKSPRKSNIFGSSNTNDYKLLHNVFKRPFESRLQNISEPFYVDLNFNARKFISDWAIIPTTKNIVSLNSNEIQILNEASPIDSEFEVYLEQSDNVEILNTDTDGNGVTLDYNFKIKFKDSNGNILVKEIPVNSSQYLLSDDDYKIRKSRQQVLDGYFKIGTSDEQNTISEGVLQNIDDYRLFGYSAVVPDLRNKDNRIIYPKVVSPTDSSKVTRDEFISNLRSLNASITDSAINNQIDEYLKTNTFSEPDSSAYPNTYSEISNLGINISKFAYDQNSYWIDNSSNYIGGSVNSDIEMPFSVKDLRNDSFNIGISGYGTANSSINILENIYDQKIKVQSGNVNQNNNYNLVKLTKSKFAFKISPTSDVEIKSFEIKLKYTYNFQNPDAYIQAELWTNLNNAPNKKIAVGSKVLFSEITNAFKNIEFGLNYKLQKTVNYWIVLSSTPTPPVYEINTPGLVNITNNSVQGIYDLNTNDSTDFTKYLVGAEMGFGTTNPYSVSSWYPIVSIGGTNSLVVSGSSINAEKYNYVLRYSLSAAIAETTITPGVNLNCSEYSSATGWSSLDGTVYVSYFTPDQNLYGSFNRSFKNSNLNLPNPNIYRSSNNYVLDQHVNFDVSNLNDSYLSIYPRSLYTKQVLIKASGTLSGNAITFDSSYYSDKIMSGMGITGASISSGTAITAIRYSETNSYYTLLLSNILLGSITNSNVYIGENKSQYIRRANDIHVNVKYYIEDQQNDFYYLLEKSPTWITTWYRKTKSDYSDLDTSIKADKVTATYNLSFNNYNLVYGTGTTNYFTGSGSSVIVSNVIDQIVAVPIDIVPMSAPTVIDPTTLTQPGGNVSSNPSVSGSGSTTYLNGFSVGTFTPKASIGNSFDLRFISSGGLKIYVDDSASPIINAWNNTSAQYYGITVENTATSVPIKLRVEFSNAKQNQVLKSEWRISGTTNSFQNVDDSFYIDNIPTEIPIDSRKISRISYVSVGKTLEEIDTPTNGAPVNDKLVIRVK